MKLFVDTYAFIAWLNPGDQAHQAVADFLVNYRGQLVTTEWVLMELADALSAPQARTVVVNFLETIRQDALFEIVGYDPSAYAAGFENFSRAVPTRLGHSRTASRFV